MSTIVDVYSPLRIDLFGNWSDHFSFMSHRPSRVINTAFCLATDRFPIHVKLTRLKQPIVRYLSVDLRVTRSLSFEEIVGTPVLNALLEYYSGSTPHEFYEELLKNGGVKVLTNSRVPLHSGLGTSSALTVSLILALWSLEGRVFDVGELAERAYIVEKNVSQCGWQDHYASAYGQALLIERYSPLHPPTISALPSLLSDMVTDYGSLIFVSGSQHPEVKWSVDGNEEILLKMDDLITDFLIECPVMTLGRLQELLKLSERLSRKFLPPEFCNRLDTILDLVTPYDCCGFLTGLGPAAVIISPEPKAMRERLAREGIRSSRLYPAPSGAVAFL